MVGWCIVKFRANAGASGGRRGGFLKAVYAAGRFFDK
jgi:hypothetical protein